MLVEFLCVPVPRRKVEKVVEAFTSPEGHEPNRKREWTGSDWVLITGDQKCNSSVTVVRFLVRCLRVDRNKSVGEVFITGFKFVQLAYALGHGFFIRLLEI